MHEDINRWFKNGCNYQEGVSLYDHYGRDSFLKTIFKRNDGSFNRNKLSECLNALIDQEPEAPVVAAEEPAKNVSTLIDQEKAKELIKEITNPPALLKLKTHINNNWAELAGLHPYLSIYPEGEELRLVAEQIVKLGRKNSELFEQLDYYHEHGQLPTIDERPAPPPVMIDLNLINRREAVRKLLSKAQQRIKGVEKPKPKTLATIERHKTILALLDEQIAAAKAGGAK